MNRLLVTFSWLFWMSPAVRLEGVGSIHRQPGDSILVPGWLEQPISYPLHYTLKDGETFDFVVVGAGAAGCPAATRLALAGYDVLLVEAGGDPSFISEIPATFMTLVGSSLDWKYKTISNNASCLSYEGNACRFTRGKCLGGSTAINGMLYTRGNPKDYDDLNLPGWSWDELLPYFLRFEGFQDIHRLPISSRPYHNISGIMKLGFFGNNHNPWDHRLLEAYRTIGFNYNPDQNDGFQIGVSEIPGFVYQGRRMSAARAFLARDNVKRKLSVSKHTLCTGVIIDEYNVATGITVVTSQPKTPLRIYARKEVILSAGAVGTPQILMLSGIGHADHLREMGLPVRADLPVGDNMSDHVQSLIFVSVDSDESIEYLVKRKGRFATNDSGYINTFFNTQCYHRKKLLNGTGCKLPTTQIGHRYLDKGWLSDAKSIFQKSFNFKDNVIDQLAEVSKDHAIIMFEPVLLHPFSRGTIRLTSSNPLDHPAIFPNYYGDSRDVKETLRAIGVVEDLIESPVFKKYNASLIRLNFPDCSQEIIGKKYWECYMRHVTVTVCHAVGTCGMPEVVDPRLRVQEVVSLRVADISVLPKIPRGNTEAIALAIGEKVADLVREDHDPGSYVKPIIREQRKPNSKIHYKPSTNNLLAKQCYLLPDSG